MKKTITALIVTIFGIGIVMAAGERTEKEITMSGREGRLEKSSFTQEVFRSDKVTIPDDSTSLTISIDRSDLNDSPEKVVSASIEIYSETGTLTSLGKCGFTTKGGVKLDKNGDIITKSSVKCFNIPSSKDRTGQIIIDSKQTLDGLVTIEI